MLRDVTSESIKSNPSTLPNRSRQMNNGDKLRKETGISRRTFIKMAALTGVSAIAISGLTTPVSADIPDVNKITIEMEGEDAVLNLEIRHDSPTSGHYIDQIDVTGTFPLSLTDEPQEDERFTYKHNLGKVEGEVVITARAHCILHGYGPTTTITTTITPPTPGPTPSPSPTPTPAPSPTPPPSPSPTPIPTLSPTPTPTPTSSPSPSPMPTTTPTTTPSPTPTPTPTPKPEEGLPLELIGLPIIALIAIGGYLVYRRTKR